MSKDDIIDMSAPKERVAHFFDSARRLRHERQAEGRIPAADMERAKAEAAGQVRRAFTGAGPVEAVPEPGHHGLSIFDMAGRKVFEMDGEGHIVTADWQRIAAMRDQLVAGVFHPSEGMVVTLAAALWACRDLGKSEGGQS